MRPPLPISPTLMPASKDPRLRGSFRGTVYGDLVGAPYMIENTYNRYFDLGETRRAYSHGRVRPFFPEVTEVSHGAAATCRWLTSFRDSPTAENLLYCLKGQFDAHPRGGWTEPTRIFLTSGIGSPSTTPDWSAVTRSIPISSFVGDDLPRALELTEACVMATCSDRETVRMAQAVTESVFMARQGHIDAEIVTMLEKRYCLALNRPDEDLRAELRGEVAEQVIMLGVPVEGAYRYRLPESPAPPSSRLVTEAALRSALRSDSWEDAVRRAVALGGPSNAVAGIAGGVAEALYGEVTPAVVGKLFTYIPTDIYRQLESLENTLRPPVSKNGPVFSDIGRDAITIVSLGPGRTTYVVPPEQSDIRRLIEKTFPEPNIILPSEVDSFLSRFHDSRTGTYPYGPRPEVRTLYVQDGARLVSPSQYVAAGMPPLQERKRHLQAFLRMRSFCIDCQKELNEKAGNPEAGPVHYGNAYHLWIGSRRIDFLFGDTLAGRLSLDGRGLLKLELGEYRDLSTDARFENHREQAWASRSMFTIAETTNPLGHLEEICNDIRSRLLDEGLGSGLTRDLDERYLSEEERMDREPVSNILHLEPLDPEQGKGTPAERADITPTRTGKPIEGKAQAVSMVYTIGYGARSQEGFINTLEMLGVDTVIDLRSIPCSRHVPQFDENILFDALDRRNIRYLSAGEKMGARPSDPSLYDGTGTVDWDRLRASTPYRTGIDAIKELAEEGSVVAISCSEGDPLSCHRFGTVSRSLEEAGMKVRHVLPNGEVVSHAEMEGRLVERYTQRNMIPSTITGSYREQLEEAYKALNRERGFRHQYGAARRPRIKR